jgi:muramidase (phage lysozyme)
MPFLAPKIEDIGTNVTAEKPVTVDYSSVGASIGEAIAEAIKFTQQEPAPTPQEAEVSSTQEIEEGYTPPYTMASSNLPVNSQSLLDAISAAEGTGGDYNIIVGGKRFESYAEHPNIVGITTKAGPSTAAGKYQITKQTWDDLQKKYPDLTDFSPENQDKAAYYLATDRYKRKFKGRDLSADLAAGNTQYLRAALQDTWTGIRIYKDFEKTYSGNVQVRSSVVMKPVGFTTIRYTNSGATRNKPVTPILEGRLDTAISNVLGTGYTVEIFSGGQEKAGHGHRRTGTIRHDEDEMGRGKAADVYILDPAGKRVTDPEILNRVGNYWVQNNLGSFGGIMKGGGLHLDEWTKDKLLPGMGITWSY